MDDASLLLSVAVLTIAIAMIVAVIIKSITFLMGRSVRGGDSEPVVEAVVPDGTPAPPEEHVAVIAAAVSVVFDDDAHIVHIQPRASEAAWSASGRQTHHTSHHLGPRTTPRHSAPRPRDPGGH
ncbi:MAG TPA: hypothetical protein GXZ30_08710 [Propionibacterium sp.]|nr:hypothetical protein [Propionibacterium sp.]